MFCRRWGVPLADGGTVRLARIVGQGHALDMILTGRPVGADEAVRMGLANRLVPRGAALRHALALAHELAQLPQVCLRSDRMSVHEQWDMTLSGAFANEARRAMSVIGSGETLAGASRFAAGEGRHGAPVGT